MPKKPKVACKHPGCPELVDPNYDLFRLSCNVSAKRLFPNYVFLDSPYNLKYYKAGHPETEVATMGCRTRVIGNVYDPTKEIAYSRGNLSFSTINLPRLGMETEMTVEEVLKAIKSNPLCRGVTYSGGEPFLQAGELSKLTRKLTGYEVAVYSGFTFEELLSGTPDQQELLSLIDVLIDGLYEESKRTLELSFRGSGNQRILSVTESLKAGKAVLETSTRWV